MINLIKKWLNKGDEDANSYIPDNQYAKFNIKVDNLKIGVLESSDSKWIFKYSSEFKEHVDEYNLIVGFPDLDREYFSESLWPFFRIRIPGLKQPAIKKILEEEQIDQNNEIELLKRFGQKTISNPYELELIA